MNKKLKTEILLSHQGGKCFYCKQILNIDDHGKGLEVSPVIEHVIARSLGGVNQTDNTVVSCHSCNSMKNAMTLVEWSKKNGEKLEKIIKLEKRLKNIQLVLSVFTGGQK